MKHLYEHDCNQCRYLGSDRVPALGKQLNKPDHVFDFYICQSRIRSLIARFGNSPEEYMSGGLFECVELTTLDRVALFNHLELSPDENERLLRVFASMFRSKLGVKDYGAMMTSQLEFGSGNVVFSD